MTDLFLYLGKSSLCLSIMLLFFVIFLQKETFFKLNRWILLANIILAISLPVLNTPSWFSNFEIVKTENTTVNPIETTTPLQVEHINPTTHKQPPTAWNWEAIIMMVFLVGFLIFLLRFLAQIFSILLLIIFNERERKESILFIYPRKIIAPFSFFNFLFIDKKAYDPPIFEQIIAHEKAHILQRHSWDILLSEILIMIQWFNPFAWWHRRLVETNLEFLADQSLLNDGVDQKVYQYNLLKIAVPNFPNSLATNYNSSLLKKRIMMMQQKKSSAAHSWKYFLLLPVALIIWTAFGNPHSKSMSTPFISIITAEATEMDLVATQEVYRKMGETFVINELKFDEEDRLSVLNATSVVGKRGKCTISIDGFESYSYQYYKRNNSSIFGTSFMCGSRLSPTDFELISKIENWDFIFINGQRPTQEKINKLKDDTEKWRAAIKEKIKNTNPKSMATTTYIDFTKKKKALVKNEINAAKTTTIYYLDGLKTDKTIDDFDHKNLRSVKLNQKLTNYYDSKGDLLETLIDTLEVKIISQ